MNNKTYTMKLIRKFFANCDREDWQLTLGVMFMLLLFLCILLALHLNP